MTRFALSLLLAAACADAAPRPVTAVASPEPFTVRVSGHGPVMILIPGLASAADVWASTVEHEQAHYTCHVLQLAGFAGQPALAGTAPLLPTVREALARYIREHHLDHPVIVGHSLGGFVALDLAIHEPDLVGKLVIVDGVPFLAAVQDPTATPESMRAIGPRIRDAMVKATPAEFAQQERGLLATMISDPGKQQIALGWALRSDRATVAEAIIEMMTTDLRTQVAKIHAPTLVIATWAGWGVGREPIEHSFAQQYGELHGAKVVVAESAKHFVMWDDPSFLFSQLDAFLP